ncbi:membrane-associated phospholipid phosphatase [Mucilaginibacter oryzae]|uniref:Membrane-associated phospholipid phosphatase n=1 Tax=Mucilaginibacter oryzae TaxID=468058 RepID=A0A316HYB9_9SPHI|nr:membrane-associated phospholipid phosphatase [Mucilaginibacter oryzae]
MFVSAVNKGDPLQKISFYFISMLLAVALSLPSYAQVKDTLQRGAVKTDSLQKDSARNILTLPDTVKHLQSKFPSYIPPAAFVTYGLLSLKVKFIRNIDYDVRDDMNKDHPGFHTSVDNYLQYAPIISVYGLNAVGVHGKNTFIDRTLLLALSEAIFAGTTFGLKRITHRTRPDGSDNMSFPSGHTGNAFVSAEFMAQEYGERSPVYGGVGYAFATTTAILRVYNNKHWFSDIIAGAGFGILSTKAAYYLYPLIRNSLFRGGNEKSNNNSLLLPTYQQGRFGLTFAKSF